MRVFVFSISVALLSSYALRAQQTYTMTDTVVAKRYLEVAQMLIGLGKDDEAFGKLDTVEIIY